MRFAHGILIPMEEEKKQQKGKYKTDVIENNLLYVELADATTPEDLEELRQWAEENHHMVQEIYAKTRKKVHTLVNLEHLRNYSAEAFSILSNLLKKNENYADKTAVLNGTTFLDLAKDTLVAHSQTKTEFKSFRTKEEAMEWLQSDQHASVE